MTKISATIVADSINEQGDRLTSLLITFPRILLSEINTHRMLSKNTSSSRAIPFLKMVEAIKDDPFIPIAWQKEHKGMQGTEYFVENMQTIPFKTIGGFELYANSPLKDINYKWLKARDRAIETAFELNSIGVTKQLANRLLEPFMWTTMLITGSKEGWQNFFELRCPQYALDVRGKGRKYFKSKKDFTLYVGKESDLNKHGFSEKECQEHFFRFNLKTDLDWLKCNKGQAEIHMMTLAEEIYDAMNESTPMQLKAGEWHIPFEDKINIPLEGTEFATEVELQEYKMKVSVAMAARTSYTVVGEEKEVNYEAMIKLHDRLLAQDPPHSSPLEHCARSMSNEEYDAFYKGQLENKEFTLIDCKTRYLIGSGNQAEHGWCNNFKGFIPYRYMVDNGQL